MTTERCPTCGSDDRDAPLLVKEDGDTNTYHGCNNAWHSRTAVCRP
jgi:hypothetical protein